MYWIEKIKKFNYTSLDHTFLITNKDSIIPVEVKAEANIASKSLKKYKELFGEKIRLRVRFSLENLKLDNDVLNIPLFMADYADKLIGMALTQKELNNAAV